MEAELRTLHIPPLLPIRLAVDKFYAATNRLLILVRTDRRKQVGVFVGPLIVTQ